MSNQRVYDLTWGWAELHYRIPWSYFPPNKELSQIVPVPFGEYELVIRGQNIEEFRQKVTLSSAQPLKLRVTPTMRGSNAKTD